MMEIRPMQEAPTDGTPIYLVIEARRSGPRGTTAVRATVRAHFDCGAPDMGMGWVIEAWTFPMHFGLQFAVDINGYLRTLHTKILGWLPVYWQWDEEQQS